MNISGLNYHVAPAGFALRASQLSRALSGSCRMDTQLNLLPQLGVIICYFSQLYP